MAKNVENKFPKLELDSNSDSANQHYYMQFGHGQHGPQTSQGYHHCPNLAGYQQQPQSATHQHNHNLFGMAQLPNAQFQHSHQYQMQQMQPSAG